MKKLALTLSCLLCIYVFSQAQFKQLAEGPEFDEPVDGVSKILRLKDGGIVYFLHQNQSDLYFQCYNNKHKQTAETLIAKKDLNELVFTIDGIYADNNDVVLLINSLNRKAEQTLKRFRIDGHTGKLKENTVVVKMQPDDTKKNFPSAFRGNVVSKFYYSKESGGSKLGIVSYNPFIENINKRIEIILFDSTNQEIAKGNFNSPNVAYNFVEFVDMVVVDQSKVFVLAYAYNKIKSEKDCSLIMIKLDADTKKVTTLELEHSKNALVTGCLMRYNPVSKKLILLSTSKTNREDKYQDMLIAYFDPYNFKVERTFEPYPVHANEKCMELFGKNDPFIGLPQNLYINDDGSFQVVYEEMTNVYKEYASNCQLGRVAVSQFDKDGKEGNSYLVPKMHYFSVCTVGPFYQAKWERVGSNFTNGNQYKPYSYLNGKNKNYVLINDLEENGGLALKGKIRAISGVSDCNAFYFVTSGPEVLPERKFVFGEPAEKNENYLALLSISDYDRENNIYVTLKLEKSGRKKQVKLVWLEPR